MNADRRESLRITLRTLAEAHAATLRLMEQTYTLLADELALAPLDYLARYSPSPEPPVDDHRRPVIDDARLTVTFRGRTCHLGNTLPFRLLGRLARRPGCYVTHDDLLADVWDGALRSEGVVRSTVKVLRQKLRDADMGDLADAIDGTAPGRYALRLDP
jgi:DNA-binding response OmpR family regulator